MILQGCGTKHVRKLAEHMYYKYNLRNINTFAAVPTSYMLVLHGSILHSTSILNAI